MLEKALESIGITGNAQNIYQHLLASGAVSVRGLSEVVGLPRSTVYDAVNILLHEGLVVERSENGVKMLSISDPRMIAQMIELKKNDLQATADAFTRELPKLISHTHTIEPKIRFFSGNNGIKKILSDMLWHENIRTATMWPAQEMLHILGHEYLEWLNEKRRRQNIFVASIRKHDDVIDFKKHPYLDARDEDMREIRYAPAWMQWDMSYWLYGDKVAFISAGQECFGFIVHSADFASVIEVQHRAVWALSSQSPYTRS